MINKKLPVLVRLAFITFCLALSSGSHSCEGHLRRHSLVFSDGKGNLQFSTAAHYTKLGFVQDNTKLILDIREVDS